MCKLVYIILRTDQPLVANIRQTRECTCHDVKSSGRGQYAATALRYHSCKTPGNTESVGNLRYVTRTESMLNYK